MWFVVLTVQSFTALVIFLTIDTVVSLIGILTKDFNKAFGFVGVVLFCTHIITNIWVHINIQNKQIWVQNFVYFYGYIFLDYYMYPYYNNLNNKQLIIFKGGITYVRYKNTF